MSGFPEHTSHHLSSDLKSQPPWIVGVLNLTPDSFSDGGAYLDESTALAKGLELIQDGANILEIGGEATGLNSTPVGADEELRRILPSVKALAGTAFVSIDTYKSQTASACLEQGARMINDVSALRSDAELINVVREHGAYLCIMYCKESHLPHVSSSTVRYTDVATEVAEFLLRRIDLALGSGIDEEKLLVDPGMGNFLSYNEPQYSWELLRNLSALQNTGIKCPIMIGTSRKSFLGGDLESRDPASVLTSLTAIQNGASLVRVHNVKMMREFIEIKRNLGPQE